MKWCVHMVKISLILNTLHSCTYHQGNGIISIWHMYSEEREKESFSPSERRMWRPKRSFLWKTLEDQFVQRANPKLCQLSQLTHIAPFHLLTNFPFVKRSRAMCQSKNRSHTFRKSFWFLCPVTHPIANTLFSCCLKVWNQTFYYPQSQLSF